MIAISNKLRKRICIGFTGVFLSAFALYIPASAAGTIHSPDSVSAEMTENRIGGGYSASSQLDGAGYWTIFTRMRQTDCPLRMQIAFSEQATDMYG